MSPIFGVWYNFEEIAPSVLRRGAAVPLQPGALKPRALKPGASKPARDFTFGIQERPRLLDLTSRSRAYALGFKP